MLVRSKVWWWLDSDNGPREGGKFKSRVTKRAARNSGFLGQKKFYRDSTIFSPPPTKVVFIDMELPVLKHISIASPCFCGPRHDNLNSNESNRQP